jgi:hypothetical protein
MHLDSFCAMKCRRSACLEGYCKRPNYKRVKWKESRSSVERTLDWYPGIVLCYASLFIVVTRTPPPARQLPVAACT